MRGHCCCSSGVLTASHVARWWKEATSCTACRSHAITRALGRSQRMKSAACKALAWRQSLPVYWQADMKAARSMHQEGSLEAEHLAPMQIYLDTS